MLLCKYFLIKIVDDIILDIFVKRLMVFNFVINVFGLGYFYFFIRSKRIVLSLLIFEISKFFERKN